LSHCVEQGNRHVQPAHIRLLLDCIDICQTSVAFMLRGSDLHQSTCATCADVCDWCAGDCERLADDEQMRTCAAICHECARICRAMAAAGDLAANQPAYGEIAALAQRLREHDGARPSRDEDYWYRAEHILRERHHAKRVGRPAPTPLKQIMTEKVECAHPNATLQEVEIRRLPILSRDDRLVGIVSIADLATKVGVAEQPNVAVTLESISLPPVGAVMV
jgi:hypothetical protein